MKAIVNGGSKNFKNFVITPEEAYALRREAEEKRKEERKKHKKEKQRHPERFRDEFTEREFYQIRAKKKIRKINRKIDKVVVYHLDKNNKLIKVAKPCKVKQALTKNMVRFYWQENINKYCNYTCAPMEEGIVVQKSLFLYEDNDEKAMKLLAKKNNE